MANVRKYQSKVVNITQPVENTYIVTFESLQRPFKFKPGQFLHLALDEYNPSMAWPDSRCFSIQTPTGQDWMKITFSVKGSFTARMARELKPGNLVQLKLPYGDLFRDEDQTANCIFIAGGTGITPFLSLLTTEKFSRYQTPKLYLGIRNPSFHLYQDEIEQSKTINPSLQVEIINQETEGIIDINEIAQDNQENSLFFLSGPPEMIQSFSKALVSNGIMPENIRTDDWE